MKKIERILDRIDDIKSLQILQGRIVPTLTQSQEDDLEDKLEIKAYTYASNYIKFLDTQIKKQCTTKKITFQTQNNFEPMARVAMMDVSVSVSSANVTKPLDTVRDKKINVAYIFECTD